MAYPVTHLYVAFHLLNDLKPESEEMFLLGSISPDAVHFRKHFQGAGMAEIGAAKKITHLCPVSGEKWGQVTDNDGWQQSVGKFLEKEKKDPFRLGYAVHVLTDIYTNMTLWQNYRTNHPKEAKKGYQGGYYDDLRYIDKILKQNAEYIDPIISKLSAANPIGIDGLVSSDEVSAIKQSLLDEINLLGGKKNCPEEKFKESDKSLTTGSLNKIHRTTFVSYDEMLIFIKDAVLFCGRVVL